MVQTRSCDPTTSVLQYDIRIRCELQTKWYRPDDVTPRVTVWNDRAGKTSAAQYVTPRYHNYGYSVVVQGATEWNMDHGMVWVNY